MSGFIYFIAQALRRVGVQFGEHTDPRVQAMQKAIRELGGIQFHIEMLSDGSWSAESTNIDGILTGGRSPEHLNADLKDAIFTFFEIPPQLCNDDLIKTPEEPINVAQRFYV